MKVFEDEHCLVFMDLYPLNRGHVLVIPRNHYTYYHEMPASLCSHLARIVQKISTALLESDLGAKGYNLINNNGKSANQHVPHLHIHVVPRYPRDAVKLVSNLMLHIPGAFLFKAGQKKLEQQAGLIRQALRG